MAEPKAAPQTTIYLDRPRTMILDFNALALIEDLTGKSLTGGGFADFTMKDIRDIFFACLSHEDDDLTPEKVGEWLQPGHLTEAMDIILRFVMGGEDPDTLAPFVPSPEWAADLAMEMASVGREDVFFDLGCGDGRTLIAAAKRGAGKVIGIEKDPNLAAIARENIGKSGFRGEVRECKVQEVEDLKTASVVYLYLLSTSNTKIRPLLMANLKKGARVVSLDFPMDGWVPERTETRLDETTKRNRTLYLYETPGPVERPGEPMV